MEDNRTGLAVNLLATWRPKQALSLNHCATTDEPSIALLRKVNRDVTVDHIVVLLTRMVNTINVTMNMNAMQIAMCANAICESKWTLRLDDIQLCLERGVMGHYGELFNRMDQMVVFEWFRKYEIERSQEIARKRDANHANNIYEVWQSPVLNQILTDVTSKLTHREIVKEDYKPREKNAGELWAEQTLKEFDELYHTSGVDGTPRMVLYKGEYMDQSQYFEARNMELLEET